VTPSLPLVGEDFAGYRLRGVLGRGGMSVVYEAENARLGNTVALKVLAPELSTDDTFRARFLKESRIAASLNHPNVIPIYDTGPYEELLYISMRYVAGSDLRTELNSRGRIPPERALQLIGQVGRALDAAHRLGLVHRDVKPANVLIERGTDEDPDHAYIADFGITKHTLSNSGLTATGQLVGTIDYIAPEQIQGKSVDGRADIYSLGCVLYECLTGRVPFVKDLDAAVIWAHVEELPAPPSTIRAELPGGIDEVIMCALAKDPDDRYQTCREFVAAARAALLLDAQTSVPPAPNVDIPAGPPTVLSGQGAQETAPPSPPTPAAAGAAAGAGVAAGMAAHAETSLSKPADAGTTSAPAAGAPVTSPPAAGAPATPVSPAGTGGSPGGPPTPPQAGPGGSPAVAPPEFEPRGAHGAGAPPGAAPPPPVARKPDPPDDGARSGGRLWYAVLVVAALVAGAVAVVLVTKSSSTKQSGQLASSALAQVPTNHVTGSGKATVRLNGNVATVTVTTNGLDYGDELVHAMHIHAGGKGECPPASAARPHNGHETISTTDGLLYYGSAVQALTTRGDTSPTSILALRRFPTGGAINYNRTITVPANVAAYIRENNAVVVVHGIDYDDSGGYTGVLERSELNKRLPATETAPALCGVLVSQPQAAAVSSRSHPHTVVYAASLTVNAAADMSPGEMFLCAIGEATPVVADTGRQASTRATA
jgi:Protein kinase domain